MRLPAVDAACLRLAEPTFQFWKNPDDAIYDRLYAG